MRDRETERDTERPKGVETLRVQTGRGRKYKADLRRCRVVLDAHLLERHLTLRYPPFHVL